VIQNLFHRQKSRGKKRRSKLVALVRSLDNVCYRYRLLPFEARLRERGWEVSADCFCDSWIRRLPRLQTIRDADVVLLQRRLLPLGELWLLRQIARRLVYDFDDAIFCHSSNSAKAARSRRREKRFAATVQAADAVIAGNDFLANAAGRFTDPAKVWRIPTCVDSQAYSPATHREDTLQPRLAWIGSASTLKSLQGASAHLEAIVRALPQARLKVICDVFPEDLPIAVIRCPWSARRERAELADATLGISWVPDAPWSQGKCGLKVLQYMAAGLPVIANSVGVHRGIVVHGRTGFLADSPEEWASAVRALAESADLRRSMGDEGRKRVSLEYSPERWAEQFIRIVENGDAFAP
jgi:glycosyltransferase involved in cell wall biosynthesis